MGENPNSNGVQTANQEKESAKKSRRKVSAIGATNESILEFIMSCKLYECDAIKVAMNIVKSGTKAGDIAEHDATILNTFLNDGLKPGAHNNVETVMTHRQRNAYRLAMTLGNFCAKKEEITVISGTLMLFASRTTHVNDILNKLLPTASQSVSNTADKSDADSQSHDKKPANTPQTAGTANATATAKQ